MQTARPAVGYTRVSTTGQASSGLGLAAQREAIERFAESEGLQIDSWHTDAETGKGKYIYTAYSWFRQLPVGNAGAYRIFANMLSLPKAGAKK